jgi:MFS family permease
VDDFTGLRTPLTIRYKTYPFGDISIGVISIKGEKFPYMISMKNDTGYGGEKSDGRKEKHIYNGQVFIRYGDSTIVASRQEDILEIVERRINTASALATLGMVTVLIGIVIGLGASFIRFSEPYSAAFLGCIVGAIVGGVFHERLTKYIGSYLSGEWNKLKPVAGFLWGAIVGAITSFWVVDSILKIGKVFNPFTIIVIVGIVMAPIIGTLVIIWPFAFFTIFKFVIHKITNRLKRI